MYVRGTDVIVMRPGHRGAEHAGERFEQGGQPEKDLLPIGDERDMYRVILRHTMPQTVLDTLPGRPVHDLISIPPFRGDCPRRGNDLGGDTLNRIADLRITHVREVERGTLVAIAPDQAREVDGPWRGHESEGE